MLVNTNKLFIYVLILNWNHKDDLIETIESFCKQTYENIQLVVIDNNSSDDSVKTVRNNYPNIKVIENSTNLGWAAGNNVGIRYALAKDADVILLANNDIELGQENLIEKLIERYNRLKSSNKLGICGCRINYFDNREETHNIGWNIFSKEQQKGKIFNKYKSNTTKVDNNANVVDYVSGCFMLIDPQVVKNIGFFDENYFMYAEEADFSLRAWSKGIASIVFDDLVVYHKIANSSGRNTPFKMYYQIRNMIYLLKKNKPIISNYKYFRNLNWAQNSKYFLKILFGKFTTEKYVSVKAFFLAIYHSLISKYGQSYK